MAATFRRYFRNGAEIIERELDGLTLFYHCPSGITHIADSPLPEIMHWLDDEPRDVAFLLERLAAEYDVDSDDALAALEQHLELLVTLGLVRTAS